VRKTSEARQETRSRLLTAAAREFADAGFAGASIDAISLAAGYSKGTVYNYFSSKEELFVAVVAAASEAAARSSAPPGSPVRERLRASLAAFCTWTQANEGFARVLVRECLMGTPGLYPRVIQAEDPLVRSYELIVAAGIADGTIRTDVPAALLAASLAGLTDLALAQHWASDQGVPTFDDIPDLVLALLLGPQPR